MYQPLRIFIGFDPVETVAYHACVQSIIELASKPVTICPINIRNLRDIYHRDRDKKQSNEFTYARFLVPYLCGYQGQALFIDCDIMLRHDVYDLFVEADERYAVSVVKHDYEPKNQTKYLGNIQYTYPRKNWSSVMVFNCSHPSCRSLDPHRVSIADPGYLHRFEWMHDREIGELKPVWNFLVGEYDRKDFEEKHGRIRLVHFTVGGPWFDEYSDVEFAQEWLDLADRSREVKQLPASPK